MLRFAKGTPAAWADGRRAFKQTAFLLRYNHLNMAQPVLMADLTPEERHRINKGEKERKNNIIGLLFVLLAFLSLLALIVGVKLVWREFDDALGLASPF